MALKPYDIEPDNLPMRYAYELISKTRSSFFLTGKAGTAYEEKHKVTHGSKANIHFVESDHLCGGTRKDRIPTCKQ